MKEKTDYIFECYTDFLKNEIIIKKRLINSFNYIEIIKKKISN